LQAIHALTFALAHLGAMAFVAAAIPPRLQASAQGLYGGGLGGIAFALATLTAGAISAAYGQASAYWLAAAMSLLAFAAALVLGRRWDGHPMDRDQT
jgi:PPP family 3-phenylpropionic acid transporter